MLILAVAYPPSSHYPAIANEMSTPTCDLAPSFPLDFRLHLDLDNHKRSDGFAAHLSSVSLGQAWNNFPRKSYASILHVRMFSGKHATQLLLSCVKSGGSGVGKGAKTKQPTFTTACQWSQQRLFMHSHNEGSRVKGSSCVCTA